MPINGIKRPAPTQHRAQVRQQGTRTQRTVIDPLNFKPLFPPEEVKFVPIKKVERGVEPQPPQGAEADALNYVAPKKEAAKPKKTRVKK